MLPLLALLSLVSIGAVDPIKDPSDGAPGFPSTSSTPPLQWQIGLGGGLPQLGGLMVRCWWTEQDAIEVRGHARAKREQQIEYDHIGNYAPIDTGYRASGEFSLDVKYLRQLFLLIGEPPPKDVLLSLPIRFRGLAYAGAGGYWFYEDVEARKYLYSRDFRDSTTGLYKSENVYRSESIDQKAMLLNLVGGAGFEVGYGRLAVNMLFGYGWSSTTSFKQYAIAPSFDLGISLAL